MYQVVVCIYARNILDLNHVEGVLDQFIFPQLNSKNVYYSHQIYNLED